MRNFFGNLGMRLKQSMYGRYGADELTSFLNLTGIIIFIVSACFRFSPLYIVTMLLFCFAIYRCYSKNTSARLKERAFYLKIRNAVILWFRRVKNMWRERKTHKYFKCKNCKVYVRVPKNKGKIEIICPKCGKRFIKTT